jgi:hypothetical protein
MKKIPRYHSSRLFKPNIQSNKKTKSLKSSSSTASENKKKAQDTQIKQKKSINYQRTLFSL